MYKKYFIDLDNTLCFTIGNDYINSKPIEHRIRYVNKLKEHGNLITIWTARGSMSGIDHRDLTVKQLEEWDNYIISINNRFKVLTTTKVNDDILCTYDDKLTIKDIASLSTKAKVVIAINSGVVPGLLNFYTLTNMKHFYIFDNNCCYSYPNFENRDNINDITFEELENYINQ